MMVLLLHDVVYFSICNKKIETIATTKTEKKKTQENCVSKKRSPYFCNHMYVVRRYKRLSRHKHMA